MPPISSSALSTPSAWRCRAPRRVPWRSAARRPEILNVAPSLAVATALAAGGWRPVNFGPDTPLESLARAAAWLEPRLVWISFTVSPLSRRAIDHVVQLSRALAASKINLVVGGQAVTTQTFPRLPNLQVFSSVAEIANYASVLAPRAASAPSRPRRRRRTEVAGDKL